MQVILDDSLKTNPKMLQYKGRNASSVVDRYADKKCTDYKNRIYSQSLFPSHNDLGYADENVCHSNYLEYLELCWATHYGVVLSPDIIWQALLCELATFIAESPESYRSLFSENPEKQKIVVQTNSVDYLPLDLVISQLRQCVPNGFANEFLPTFSTTTDRSTLAMSAAFADVVSPYYSYSTCLCGISKIRLDGTEEDWRAIARNWKIITERLSSLSTNKNFPAYTDSVGKTLAEIPKADPTFLKNIIQVDLCGSGSETELTGWITQLCRIQPKGVRKVCNFSSWVSKVEYTNLETEREFLLMSGLFQSRVEDDFLVPDFRYIAYEKKTEEKTTQEEQPVKIMYSDKDGTREATKKDFMGFFGISKMGQVMMDSKTAIEGNLE